MISAVKKFALLPLASAVVLLSSVQGAGQAPGAISGTGPALWQVADEDTTIYLFREWTHVVAEAIRASAGDRNVTEWCKTPECWRSVKLAAAIFKDPMPPELQTVVVEGGRWGDSASEVRVSLDPDDLAAIAACRSTDASDWIRILEWANESGRLDGRQREFVSTLGANAASGWQKDGPRAIARFRFDPFVQLSGRQ